MASHRNRRHTGPALEALEDRTTPAVFITEIMYNPASSEDDWEWVEVYNDATDAVDVSGYVLDDGNGVFHTAANIAAGSVPGEGTAVLYNADDISAADFEAAWGGGLNLIAVTNWGNLGLNNGGDTVALWESFADYEGDENTYANAIDTVEYDDGGSFPAGNNSASIYLTDVTADNGNGANWALSEDGTDGAITSSTGGGNSGSDVGSPDAVPGGGSGGDMIDLSVEKTANVDIARPGDTVSYTVTVTNADDADVDATGITLLDLVPDEFGTPTNITTSEGGASAGGGGDGSQDITVTPGATEIFRPGGPRNDNRFFNIQGSGNDTNASFTVADFELEAVSNIDGVTNIEILLGEDSAGFSTDGSYEVYLAENTDPALLDGDQITYQGGEGFDAIDPDLQPINVLLGTEDYTVGEGSSVIELTLSGMAETVFVSALGAGETVRFVFTPVTAATSATYSGSEPRAGFGPAPNLTFDYTTSGGGDNDITWTDIALAPGESATLSYDVTAPDVEATYTNFVEVTTADQADADSTPGNGTAPTPAEDDEAAFDLEVSEEEPVELFLNEVLFNGPGSDTGSEYIELRGTPDGVIPDGTYLLYVEGDNNAPGTVDSVFDLSGLALGSEGYLVLLQGGSDQNVDDLDATVLTATGTGYQGLDDPDRHQGGADIENGSGTFILVQLPSAPAAGDDLDTNDDGTPDALPGAAVVFDSVAASDGDDGDLLYAPIAFGPAIATGPGGLVTDFVETAFIPGYLGRAGDTVGSLPGDWAAAAVGSDDDEPPFALNYTETVLPFLTGRALDHIGTTNFAPTAGEPPVNFVPGGQNVPTNDTLTFSPGGGNPIVVTDSDSATGEEFADYAVELVVTQGTLDVDDTAGLTSFSGLGTATVTLEGDLNTLNSALEGLSYIPAADFDGNDTLTVTADDQGNTGGAPQTDVDEVPIVVGTGNNPPELGDATATVAENSPIGTAVIDLDATDPDPDPTLTYAIIAGDDGGAFAIDADAGVITVADPAQLDFEGGTAQFTLTVEVRDEFDAADEAEVTIDVTDVNEAPAFDAGPFDFEVEENSPAATPVGAVSATDPDADDTLTYAITAGNDGDAFAIDAGTGAITVDNPDALDFESDPDFTLTVTVTDRGGLAGGATVNVTVLDVNEPPAVTEEAFELPENSPIGTAVGTIGVTDEDGDQTFTFEIISGNTGGAFALDVDTGALTVADPTGLDFETAEDFVLNLRVADGGGQEAFGSVTVSLTDVNEPPELVTETFSLAENPDGGQAIGTVRVNDPDADESFTFEILNGDPDGIFAIDGDGLLTVADPAGFDFEGTQNFALAVEVIDSGGIVDIGSVFINLTNVNESPSLGDVTFTVPENADDGLGIGTVTADDPDAGDVFAYRIIGGNEDTVFSIGNNGIVVLVNSSLLDFETEAGSEFVLTVEATDNGGLTATAEVTVEVLDRNEAPDVEPATLEVPVNAAAGFQVGTVAVSDQDAGDTFTLAITEGNTGDAFSIDSLGRLTVADPTAIADGTATDFALTVEATDSAGLVGTGVVSVNVGDRQNNAPTVTDDNFTLNPGEVGTFDVLANDDDADDDELTLTAVSAPAGGTAEVADGLVVYTPGGGFSGPDSFTYTVIDGQGGTSTGTVNVTVLAVPEAPTGVSQNEVNAYAVSAGPGGPNTVTLFRDGREEAGDFGAFFGVVPGGARSAAADVNGDGVVDLVVGTGPGIVTRVRVLDGATGNELLGIAPFEESFTGGVFVAAGDFDADGKADIVITPDEGGGPRVRVFTAEGAQLADFFGIEDPAFRGGARPAVGDVNGDGVTDLAVSAGFEGGPRTALWEGTGVANGTPVKLANDFFVFEQSLRNGSFVTLGDINGDGRDDLIVGGGPGGAARVRAFDSQVLLTGAFDPLDPGLTPGAQLLNFFAGSQLNRGGGRVAAKDLDGDDFADLVVAGGPGSDGAVRVFDGAALNAGGDPVPTDEFFPFGDDFTGGVFVG